MMRACNVIDMRRHAETNITAAPAICILSLEIQTLLRTKNHNMKNSVVLCTQCAGNKAFSVSKIYKLNLKSSKSHVYQQVSSTLHSGNLVSTVLLII